VKHVIGKPPVYDLICERIGVPVPGAVITYGDTMYSLRNVHVDVGLRAHEEMHAAQQELFGVDAWWERYTTDREFRLLQEVEAYRRQYLVYRNGLPRKIWRELLRKLSKDLSGPLYGYLVKRQAAEDLIAS
jgi:hypothetical protein